MIAPHHGSKTSSTEMFVKAVNAQYVIFTVGYLNRFKHPKPTVLSRFLTHGAELYRSDYHGAITMNFIRDSKLEVTAERINNK